MSDDNYLNPECDEAVRAALANSDACWRMEQEVLQRKLDEAKAEVARRGREHEALLETAQKALANTEAERDRARQACNAYWHDLMRIASLCEQTADEYPLKAVERTIKQFQEVIKQRDEARHRARRACQMLIAEVGAHGPADVDSVAERSAAEIQNLRDEIEGLRAEVEMLRGVGCREAKKGEPESGPCGVCLKCAEERGAKWALDAAHKEVVWAVDQDRANINVRSLTGLEVCDFARKYEP